MKDPEVVLTAVTMASVPRDWVLDNALDKGKRMLVVKESQSIGYHEPANSKSGFFEARPLSVSGKSWGDDAARLTGDVLCA